MCCCYLLITIFLTLELTIVASTNNSTQSTSIHSTSKLFDDTPLVRTKAGLVAGFRHLIGVHPSTGHRTEADVFLGIPFAQPPVGKLRFEVFLIIKKSFE